VVYAGDIAEEGDIVQEPEWVELVAKIVKPELTVLGQSLDVQTQVKIAYGYEIRAYSYEKEPETEAIEFATDFIVVEDIDGGWKPRVVVEAKVGSVTTHDAITYRQTTGPSSLTCATALCSATASTTLCRGDSTGTAPNLTS
jgi:hypothetical protein